MFILFGTRGMKSTVSDTEPLHNQCPNCSGTLQLKKYKRWFTLFFIPIFPFETLEVFYECNSCKSAYAEKIKDLLKESEIQQAEAMEKTKALFAETLIATMTHMAMIDNDFAFEEEREIEDTINQFPEYGEKLHLIKGDVKINGNRDNYIFNLLNEVRNELSAEAVLNLLAKSAVVLLADGKIEKEEEELMKEYLIACGIPKDYYNTLLEKLKKIEVDSTLN